MKGQLKTYHDARPAKKQHTKPCLDCPFRRSSLRGYVPSVKNWIKGVHGEAKFDCHVVSNQQCAGAAIYRANVCKVPRRTDILQLPEDHVLVFSSLIEFVAHHKRG
jgi:hypothetical protein